MTTVRHHHRRSLFPPSTSDDNEEDSDLGRILPLEDSSGPDEEEEYEPIIRSISSDVVQTPDHTVRIGPMKQQQHCTPHETAVSPKLPKLTRKSVSGTACGKRKLSRCDDDDSPESNKLLKFEPKNPKVRTILFPENMDRPRDSSPPSPFSIPPDKFYSNQADIMDLIRKPRRASLPIQPVKPVVNHKRTKPDKPGTGNRGLTDRKRPKRPVRRVAKYDPGSIKDYLESYRELNKENENQKMIIMPKVVPEPDGLTVKTVVGKRPVSPGTDQPRKFFKSNGSNRTVTLTNDIKLKVDNKQVRLVRDEPVQKSDSFMSEPDEMTGLVDLEGIITSLEDSTNVPEGNKLVVPVHDPRNPSDDSILIHEPVQNHSVSIDRPVQNLKGPSNHLTLIHGPVQDHSNDSMSIDQPVQNLKGHSNHLTLILEPVQDHSNDSMCIDQPVQNVKPFSNHSTLIHEPVQNLSVPSTQSTHEPVQISSHDSMSIDRPVQNQKRSLNHSTLIHEPVQNLSVSSNQSTSTHEPVHNPSNDSMSTDQPVQNLKRSLNHSTLIHGLVQNLSVPSNQSTSTHEPVQGPSHDSMSIDQPVQNLKRPFNHSTLIHGPAQNVKPPSTLSHESPQIDPILSPISQMCNVTSGLALNSPKRGKNLTAQLSRLANLSQTVEKPRKKLRKTDHDQMIIDAGQRRFGEEICPTCNLMYHIGDKQSEDYHMEYHKGYWYFKFTGWRHERVVANSPSGKIIQVKPEDSKLWWKKCVSVISYVNNELGCWEHEKSYVDDHQVFLYVKKKLIVGFLLATPKSSAHRILPVEEKKPDRISEEVFPVRCGVSRIWVSSHCRKKGIARALMDALKINFIFGTVLKNEDIALTPPTELGRIFAGKYFENENFLVYLP